MKRIVIALGGNALQEAGKPATAESQLEVVEKTSAYIADIIEAGYDVVIAHGNGPQVGRIVLQNETATNVTPAMPFDVCGAMSQGYIGYHIQQGLSKVLRQRGIQKQVVTLVTQVVVDRNDPKFQNPSKPIGPFYTKEEAEAIAAEKGYAMKEDAGRGYRRVVASPLPVRIVELDADALVILTAVENVSINYKKPDQKDLSLLTVDDARKYIAEGQFAPGSMLPKVEAAMKFALSKADRKCIITSLEKAVDALNGTAGTTVTL